MTMRIYFLKHVSVYFGMSPSKPQLHFAMLQVIIFKTGPEESGGFSAAPHGPILKERKSYISVKALIYLIITLF